MSETKTKLEKKVAIAFEVPDISWDEITSSNVTMRGSKEGLTVDLGFTQLVIPWSEMQIWDFEGYNPVQIYRGNIQYHVAFSSVDIKSGGNIRCFASKIKLMVNVKKELFEYIAKCHGVEDKIATWQATATEYKPSNGNNSSDNADDANDASEEF